MLRIANSLTAFIGGFNIEKMQARHFIFIVFITLANNAFALYIHNDGVVLSASYSQGDCPSNYYEIQSDTNTYKPINNVTGCSGSYTASEISNDWYSEQYEEVYVHNDGIELSATYNRGECPSGYYEVQPASFAAITGGNCQNGFSQFTDMTQCADDPDSSWCPMLCDSGYNFTYDGQCSKLCTNGLHVLRHGNDDGKGFPLYDTKNTTPSIVIPGENSNCYVNLTPGKGSNAIHVQYNNLTYHTTY